MPAPEVRDLVDYAVLWAAAGVDSYGRATVSSPVEVRCRWEGMVQESMDPMDTVQSYPTEVFVDRAVAVGSIMWHGRLADVADPPTNLLKVVGYDATPDLKGRVMQRTVTLAHHAESLPTVV